MRFLIVEDDADVRDVLAADLQARGHDVVPVGTVADGRNALDGGGFDVLVVDVGLPDGRGLNLAAEASARGCKPVIISGNLGAMHLLRDRHLPFLEKPFTTAQLLEAVGIR